LLVNVEAGSGILDPEKRIRVRILNKQLH